MEIGDRSIKAAQCGKEGRQATGEEGEDYEDEDQDDEADGWTSRCSLSSESKTMTSIRWDANFSAELAYWLTTRPYG